MIMIKRKCLRQSDNDDNDNGIIILPYRLFDDLFISWLGVNSRYLTANSRYHFNVTPHTSERDFSLHYMFTVHLRAYVYVCCLYYHKLHVLHNKYLTPDLLHLFRGVEKNINVIKFTTKCARINFSWGQFVPVALLKVENMSYSRTNMGINKIIISFL